MHHEMVNGQGYPQGLKDEQIPLQAKIVSVADTFDAVTIDRPYQKALPLDKALEMMTGYIGTRYDGKVVAALIEACKHGEVANGVVRQRVQTGKAPDQISSEDDILEFPDTSPPGGTLAVDNPTVISP